MLTKKGRDPQIAACTYHSEWFDSSELHTSREHGKTTVVVQLDLSRGICSTIALFISRSSVRRRRSQRSGARQRAGFPSVARVLWRFPFIKSLPRLTVECSALSRAVFGEFVPSTAARVSNAEKADYHNNNGGHSDHNGLSSSLTECCVGRRRTARRRIAKLPVACSTGHP